MGFIHDTKSEIFGIETRSDSAILKDTDVGRQHLFIRYVSKCAVRDEIAAAILKTAGEFYGQDDLKNAEKYRELSQIVKQTALSYDEEPHCFEASYEWLKELVKFANENEEFKKALK